MVAKVVSVLHWKSKFLCTELSHHLVSFTKYHSVAADVGVAPLVGGRCAENLSVSSILLSSKSNVFFVTCTTTDAHTLDDSIFLHNIGIIIIIIIINIFNVP